MLTDILGDIVQDNMWIPDSDDLEQCPLINFELVNSVSWDLAGTNSAGTYMYFTKA